MNETRTKIEKVRGILKDHGFAAVRLRGVDWFSWATGGGSSVVIMTSEVGIAEVLISETGAWILTNRIESERLAVEEVGADFEMFAAPWQSTRAIDEFVASRSGSGRVCSDRPCGGESPLPAEFRQHKLRLGPEEAERYRKIGRIAAEAMTDALAAARPEWTEERLAGEGARALWSRGLEPTLVLVGSQSRVIRYRHPVARKAPLGEFAMMVFCARGAGLYANLTRFVFFREPGVAERAAFAGVARVEAAAFRASVPGRTLAEVYESIRAEYGALGRPGEIDLHHQGGPTGYLSREFVAGPESHGIRLEQGMALAWNPSLPGAKIEDTVLLGRECIEAVTVDPRWPTTWVDGRERPDIWVRK